MRGNHPLGFGPHIRMVARTRMDTHICTPLRYFFRAEKKRKKIHPDPRRQIKSVVSDQVFIKTLKPTQKDFAVSEIMFRTKSSIFEFNVRERKLAALRNAHF